MEKFPTMDPQLLFRLEKAVNRRAPLRQVTNAIRLINHEAGLEGLTLEEYDRHFVLQVFAEKWLAQRETLTWFVKDTLGGKYLIVKDRSQSSAAVPGAIKTGVWINEWLSSAVVQEHGLKFAVDLNDALNSGLFLDMRHNRKLVGGLAKGRKVLNGFSYTCSFGVHCRLGGAQSAINVDISAKALARGRANYELNALNPRREEFIRSDILTYLKRALKSGARFDLIILDPPSFSQFEGKTFRVKKNLPVLLELAIRVLNPKGVLFASTNLSTFTHTELERMVHVAARQRPIKKLQRLGQDADFTGTHQGPESHMAAVLVDL